MSHDFVTSFHQQEALGVVSEESTVGMMRGSVFSIQPYSTMWAVASGSYCHYWRAVIPLDLQKVIVDSHASDGHHRPSCRLYDAALDARLVVLPHKFGLHEDRRMCKKHRPGQATKHSKRRQLVLLGRPSKLSDFWCTFRLRHTPAE